MPSPLEIIYDFDIILNQLHEGVVILNKDTTIVYCNNAYGKILDIPPQKVLGKKVSVIEPHTQALQVLKTGKPIVGMYEHVKSLNKHVIVNIVPLISGNTIEGIACIFSDHTEYIRLHSENEQLLKSEVNFEKYTEFAKIQILKRNYLNQAFEKILGLDPHFIEILKLANKVAGTDINILIEGESGVGKDLFSRAIHESSNRQKGPFVAVNCAAFPESLIESEFFGYSSGAFTGSMNKGKKGKFELANGGTLFLDEIGELPLSVQAKFLRVLQDGVYYPIGSEKTVKVDVRIISATNQNLKQMVNEKKFREDLFFRLNEISMEVPPLRKRTYDINYLADHFLNVYCKKFNKLLAFSSEVRRFFQEYSWPGNVRELQNLVKRCVVLAERKLILLEDLPAYLTNKKIPKSDPQLGRVKNEEPNKINELNHPKDDEELSTILDALNKANNNRTKAMEILGVSRRTFYNKLKKFKIK